MSPLTANRTITLMMVGASLALIVSAGSAAAQEAAPEAGEAKAPDAPPQDTTAGIPPTTEEGEAAPAPDATGGSTSSAYLTAPEAAPPPIAVAAPVPAPARPVPVATPPAVPAKAPEKAEKPWTDYIKLKGDFRYRFELIKDKGAELRFRNRIRARVGVIGTVTNGLQVGVQLATGEGQGPDRDPVSSNQTLSRAFSGKPLWVDLAYAEWKPGFAEGFALVIGKMSNPFFTVEKSELLWDPDLNPEGIALGYKRAFGIAEPFVQTGGFVVEERKADDDAWILGAQGGLKLTFIDGLFHILAGAGYIDYTHIKGHPVYYDPTDSAGNSSVAVPPDDPASTEDPELLYTYDYNLVEGFAEVGGRIWKFPWAVFGSLVDNTAVSNDNLGWLAGVSFGKCKESLDFCLRYIYRQVSKDAVVGAFTDSDFIGGGTDGKGHEWNAGFQIIKNLELSGTYFYNQKGLDDSVDYHRGQIDLQLKF